MHKRRIAAAALAALLLCVTPALAAPDMDYEGVVEGYSPTSGGNTVQSAGGSGERVALGGGMYYDRSSGDFVYPVTTGYGEVHATVADGMVTTDAVIIAMDDGVNATLYRNGNPVESADLNTIEQTGQYSLNVSGNGSQNVRLFSFTIVGEATGLLTGYAMPDGFVIDEATCSGSAAERSASYVSMTQEGEYVVNYRCPSAKLSYTLRVTVDHTAPTLALAAVQNGIARGPVSLADAEEGASLYITLNGQRYVPSGKELTRSGSYQLQITDAAGNTSSYQFSIAVYFDGNSFVFLGILLAVLAALGVYLLRARKHLRVR